MLTPVTPAPQASPAAGKGRRRFWFWFLIGLAFLLERQYHEMHLSKLLFFSSFAVPALGYPAPHRWLMFAMVALLDGLLMLPVGLPF
jgi:hypothetical protein